MKSKDIIYHSPLHKNPRRISEAVEIEDKNRNSFVSKLLACKFNKHITIKTSVNAKPKSQSHNSWLYLFRLDKINQMKSLPASTKRLN